MRFRCTSEYCPQVSDPSDYIYGVTVDILCRATNGAEIVAGRVALEQLDIGRAINNRQDLFEICDAQSQDWYHIYSAIVEPRTYDLRDEFEFEEPLISVMCLRHFVLSPGLRAWQMFVFDSLSHLYSHESAFVMWNDRLHLPQTKLAKLGFRRIAGTELLLRPNMDKHRYCADRDRRSVLDLRVPIAAADYVEAEWRKIQD